MKTIITIIRVAVGWHFLYEGLIKLFGEGWSSASYLNNTYGFLSGFYHWLAASPARLGIVDFLNIWGLILIGLALFLGLFVRWASLAGALLLTLYYFAYPPFGVSLLGGNSTVYIINQLFIEASVLVFFFCYREKGYGLDHLLCRDVACRVSKSTTASDTDGARPVSTNTVKSRREHLKDLVALPVLGLFGWGAYRSGKIYGADTLSGATIQINQVSLGELKGELPKGKLGPHEITRLVAGGNLVAGYAHARDLIYVDSLVRAYNTEKKIFETLMMSEQAGINCISVGFRPLKVLAKYKKMTGSKIKVIAQIGPNDNSNDIFENTKLAIDLGMDIIQVHGSACDSLVLNNRLEVIEKMLSFIRSNGLVAGLGAHAIYSQITCEENGIIPDYYMMTLHHDNYWSAHPRENRETFEAIGRNHQDHNKFHDNCFCAFPDRTVAFINRTRVPVMGYKVLAAGAIHPRDGFKWAFENGADFICVGMFDFQVVDDVNICIDTLQNLQNRERRWYT